MRDVFEGLRDMPEPPLRPSADVLAEAKRSTKRRNLTRTAGALAATFAVAIGVPVALGQFQPRPAGPPIAAAPSVSASPSNVVPPQAPAPEAVDKHAAKIVMTLTQAVSSGYQAEAVQLTGDNADPPQTYTVRYWTKQGGYRAMTLVRVTADHGYGLVAAFVGTDLPSTPADPCADHRDLGIESATVETCTMTSVAGIPVRLVTGTDKGVGQVIAATRYLRGGYVVVTASQGMREYRVADADRSQLPEVWQVEVNPQRRQPLRDLPVSADRLTALAADPALLP